ncbi:hypothetical protein G6O67_004252 [Ophiocordyceps sinensis]|uniref:Uncharacterized protein n=1 Tax=Ophiocordyceps sinensis TaxID=72228 RepID=A0A8H4PNZ8_9HYPO|nr:hypothetical protein G6O67_004252 [Ophiocordyceps sinensis]
MIGQALALQRNSARTKDGTVPTSLQFLLPHYLRFFHFNIPEDYVESYEALAGADSSQTELEGVLKMTSIYLSDEDTQSPNGYEMG